MRKVLVTGVSGFVGQHLVRELKSQNCMVYGLDSRDRPAREIVDLLNGYMVCDLTDPKQVSLLPLKEIDIIINLAGLANVGNSFAEAERYKRINVGVLKILGETLLNCGTKTRVIAVSTGAVYAADQTMPLTEYSKLVSKDSPYSHSKILMEREAKKLNSAGLDIVVVRPFNHIGPGQAAGFLVPDLYQKLLVAQSTGNIVKVGNLETKRDYTDVRDIVRAYTAISLADTLSYNLYNICSGRSTSGQEILDIYLREMNLSGKVLTEVDSALIRPNDPPDLYGSNERIYTETGWQPTIELVQTIKDFVSSNQVNS